MRLCWGRDRGGSGVFFAARTTVIDPWLPETLRRADPAELVAPLQAGLKEQADALADLRGQVEALPTTPDLGPLQTRIDELAGRIEPLPGQIADLSGTLAALEGRLDDLEARLTAVEKASRDAECRARSRCRLRARIGGPAGSLAAQRAEVDKMIAAARAKEAEARALKEQAQAEARRAATRAVLARLTTAVAAGEGYAPILSELESAGLTIPAVLSEQAETGVPSLAALREGFPPAARAALAAVREEAKGRGRCPQLSGTSAGAALGQAACRRRRGCDPVARRGGSDRG
ncbi:hypothetical protein ACFOHS_16315 [Jhaorihella thermophila]